MEISKQSNITLETIRRFLSQAYAHYYKENKESRETKEFSAFLDAVVAELNKRPDYSGETK